MATLALRDQLQFLVSSLPEDELQPALRFLEYLRDRAQFPAWQALDDAPVDDEPLSVEEREALREAYDEVARGDILSHEDLKRSLLQAD